MSVIYIKIRRADPGQIYSVDVVDVAVTFSSRCIAPALAATLIDPPWGAEYEHEIKSIDVVDEDQAPLNDDEREAVADVFDVYWPTCDQIARDEAAQ